MRRRFLSILLAAAAIAVGPSAAGAQSPESASPATPSFNASFGDLMLMLVQPRHAKLAIAGQERNWPLAAYAVHELKDALANIARLKPRFRNNSVTDMMAATAGAPIAELEQATKAADFERFNAAFGRLTEGCNSCHAALNHAFVVIKTPSQSAFPNQEFRALH